MVQQIMKKYRGFCLFLSMVLIFMAIPFEITYGEELPLHWDISKIPCRDSEGYTLIHTPAFGESEPMVLTVAEAVYPNGEKENILNAITIENLDDSSKKLKMKDYTIEYIQENEVKKTKVSFYPVHIDHSGAVIPGNLEKGTHYKISMNNELFKTKEGKKVEAMTLDIYTQSDNLTEKKTIDRLENNTFRIKDIHDSDQVFSIIGTNFHQHIIEAWLKPHSGNTFKEFQIDLKDVKINSPTKIDIGIKGDLRNNLSLEENSGDYSIELIFDNGSYLDEEYTVGDAVYKETVSSIVYGQDTSNRLLHIEGKGKPIVKDKYPVSENGRPWYDEKGLKHDVLDDVTEDHQFIKVVFKNEDSTLELGNIGDLKNCIVRSAGGTGNLVDFDWIDELLNLDEEQMKNYKEKYIFVSKNKESTLYIPVKNLRAQNTYQVILPPDIVYYKDTMSGNDSLEWTFSTTPMPQVQEISSGTIPENYDEDEPFYITGDFFDTEGNVRVYFNDIEADDVVVINSSLLKVYLPSGRDHLEPGVYDILIENDKNHQRILYGTLSVIKAGDKDDIPNEEYKIKEDGSYGEVRGFIKRSEDTLLLSSSDINEKELKVNLDEAMGTEVYVRKIFYEGDKKYKIGMLKTKSKWADITLYGLTVDPYAEDDEIEVSLGRVEPTVQKNLKRKLRGQGILSDFIQVSGKNFKIDNVRLSIPFKNNTARNIKVLRYDEVTRNFYEEYATINAIDGKVELLSPVKGIFVVVAN